MARFERLWKCITNKPIKTIHGFNSVTNYCMGIKNLSGFSKTRKIVFANLGIT